MSLVDHLDELRARLVTCLAVFGVALALCFWQNHLLLEIANAPLPKGHEQLLTLGITEPFSTTLTVSAYAAIILALDAAHIRWQMRFNPRPLFIAQPKEILAHDPNPFQNRIRIVLSASKI